MKIKLAILERDPNYLSRIVSVFGTRYADKLEIYSFTERETALASLESAKIDVLISNDAIEIDTAGLPKRCGFAYLADSADIGMINGQKAICKFQKAELIYKQILGIYSEHSGSVSSRKSDGTNTKTIAFQSAGGGTGASTMAAAAALHFATQDQKALYLNLEKFGSSDVFFSAEGQFDMSDIIYAIKSKKANLPLRLESCVKQDPRGVYFFSQPKNALDMFELDCEDTVRLISEQQAMGLYDYIVIDSDFGIDQNTLKICRQAHSVVWVSDGSEISNQKICRAYETLATMEKNAEFPLTERLCLLYSKFSNKTGRVIEGINVKSVGGAPYYEHVNARQVIDQLCKLEMFDKII